MEGTVVQQEYILSHIYRKYVSKNEARALEVKKLDNWNEVMPRAETSLLRAWGMFPPLSPLFAYQIRTL